MASAAFPSVIAAVFTVATNAVVGTRVVRGRDLSQDYGDVVLIGRQDPEDDDWSSAGNFQQSMQTFGGGREEVGTVNGMVIAWNGDGNQDAANSAAFAHFALLETAVRADPKLGLTSFDYVVSEIDSGDVRERQDDDGATAVLPFVISYKVSI